MFGRSSSTLTTAISQSHPNHLSLPPQLLPLNSLSSHPSTIPAPSPPPQVSLSHTHVLHCLIFICERKESRYFICCAVCIIHLCINLYSWIRFLPILFPLDENDFIFLIVLSLFYCVGITKSIGELFSGSSDVVLVNSEEEFNNILTKVKGMCMFCCYFLIEVCYSMNLQIGFCTGL